MFLFGKKKEKSEKTAQPDTQVNREELIQKAEETIQKLNKTQGDARIDLLNEIGSLYFQANEYDTTLQLFHKK